MKRKVVKQGPATCMVSLPSKWVKEYHIKAGEDIEVEEKGSILNIYAGKGKELGETTVIIVPGTIGFLKSIIANAYKKGYDTVRINFDDPAVISKINEVIETLMGFEIIEEGDNYCIAQNVAKGIESQYDALMKKSYNMTLDSGKLVYNELKTSDFSASPNIFSKRNTVTKFTDFCKRLININLRSSDTLTFNYVLVWTLEKISNEFMYIHRYCEQNNIKEVSPHILKFFEHSLNQLESFIEAFYS
ncbi:hypothetical protein ACFL96_04260, partial [Thermoproteota archaeon]